MANEKLEKLHRSAQVAGADRLSSYGLDELVYWIFTNREKFNVQKFREAIRAKGEDEHYDCTLLARNPAIGYSVRVEMWTKEKDVTVQLMYSTETSTRTTRTKRNVVESGPCAEEFGEWLGQFFKHETTQGHIHGHFSYPLASRVSKFPLPLKTSIEEAEVDGVSLRLPAKPEGVLRVRLTLGDEEWYVEVIANRRVIFKGFDPLSDVKGLAFVVNTLLEERKS